MAPPAPRPSVQAVRCPPGSRSTPAADRDALSGSSRGAEPDSPRASPQRTVLLLRAGAHRRDNALVRLSSPGGQKGGAQRAFRRAGEVLSPHLDRLYSSFLLLFLIQAHSLYRP